MGWTEERIAELKKLWAEGHSASQIATKLGGITRNSVISKVHRLGLSSRATPSRPVKRPPRVSLPRPVNVSVALLESLQNEPIVFKASVGRAADAVMDLKSTQCKWPIGDPLSRDFSFCGLAQCDGGPYCSEHRRVGVQPSGRRVAERVLV